LRAGGRGLKIVAMTTSRNLILRLEPSADGARIAGCLRDERGNEHHFTGWLGLLTLLEQARVTGAYEAHQGVDDAGDMKRHLSMREGA
jgi:hypothetical protein